MKSNPQVLNIFHGLFIWLLLFVLLIVLLWVFPIPEKATGFEHPEFSTMLAGEGAVPLSSHAKWLSYAFGIGVIGVFCFILLIGTRKAGRFIAIHNWILGMISVYLLFYTLMTFSYWDFSTGAQIDFWGTFPTSTAWMMYGLWACPLIFTIVSVLKFKDWVISDEEEQRFKEIVERRNRN